MANKTKYKYSDEQLILLVKDSKSVVDVMRKLGIKSLVGGCHRHITNRIRRLNLDTSHFYKDRGIALSSLNRKMHHEQILVLDRSNGVRESCAVLRRALDEIGILRICDSCGQGEIWKERSLVLEIDHINSDPLDNRRENLQYLCPNCHQQKTLHADQRPGAPTPNRSD